MILKRIYQESLAHASYLVGCTATGEAMVIDPNRDIDQYLAAAKWDDLRIVAVAETHIHADYLSGAKELAARAGATLYLSGEGGPDWQYAFASEAKLLKDGDSFKIGSLRFDVMKTPGHTPEHISFVLTDEATSDLPAMVFSGDFVFVGDVGRPDLLESAVGHGGTMEPAARQLFDSLQTFKGLRDDLLLRPAHGAGSACGKSLGDVPVSTIGLEKRANWALKANAQEEFVNQVLSGQPEPPPYFAIMKRLNQAGPPPVDQTRIKPRLAATVGNRFVLDVRPSPEFAKGHFPGSIHIPLRHSFLKWAGWLVPYDQDLLLVANTEAEAGRAARLLSLIGVDRVAGWIGSAAIGEYGAESHSEGTFAQGLPKDAYLIDVRNDDEWNEGHVPDAHHIPLSHLAERTGEIPRDRPVAVHCGSGGRSAIAASVLQRAGIPNVVDMTDGFEGYQASRGS